MNERVRYRPFTGDSDRRFRLDAAPLELVLCQIRWPPMNHLHGDLKNVVESFGRLIPEYQLYSSPSELAWELTPTGLLQAPASVSHTWSRADRSATVTLSPTFVTLSDRNYSDFKGFAAELAKVISAVREALNVPLFDRVGVRYINRISDPIKVEKIDQLVKPELMGHQALNAASDDVVLVQAITQSLYQVGEGYLQARSGIVPPGETVDPALMPLDTPSWVLDIDSFNQSEAVFSSEAILAHASKLSDAAYDFFKLVIRDSFIDEFEGRML